MKYLHFRELGSTEIQVEKSCIYRKVGPLDCNLELLQLIFRILLKQLKNKKYDIMAF